MIIGTRTNDPTKAVRIDSDGLLHHSLVVGQSGSGKSFFVARLIEEVVLSTLSRVLIIDPNGDFRAIHKCAPTIFSEFRRRFAEVQSSGGRNPDYDEEETFTKAWGERRFLHLYPNATKLPDSTKMVLHRRLVVHWDSLDDDDKEFLLRSDGNSDPRTLLGLEACVDFARYFATKPSSWFGDDLRGLINAAEQFAARNLSLRQYEYAKDLDTDDWFAVRAMLSDLLVKYTVWHSKHRDNPGRPRGLSNFVDGPFGEASPDSEEWWDVLTIALDAARQADALLIVNTALSRLWRDAKSSWRRATRGGGSDERVPTIIVVDEAQNFAPASSSNPLRSRVTEQLIQIASEGRKYGVYLILATQRPTKLHPELVPECENSCVLRVQSKLDTEFASKALGLEPRNAAMAPGFVTGQGLLSGRWIDSEVEIDARFAPARTIVGGGGLPASWKTRTSGSAPFSVRDPRSVVLEELSEAKAPVTLVDLAETVRAECPEVDDSTWDGEMSFKAFVLNLGIAELRVAPQPPGFAYLEGMHVEVDEVPEVYDRLQLAPEDVRPALAELQRETSIPLLEGEAYRALFETISEVLATSQFNLTETSKAVRDLLRSDRGMHIGRGAINYVLKGISWSGHRYDSDLPQDTRTLALAFSKQLLRSLSERSSIVGESLLKAVEYCTGGLVSLGELRAIRSGDTSGLSPETAPSRLQAQAPDQADTDD